MGRSMNSCTNKADTKESAFKGIEIHISNVLVVKMVHY